MKDLSCCRGIEAARARDNAVTFVGNGVSLLGWEGLQEKQETIISLSHSVLLLL